MLRKLTLTTTNVGSYILSNVLIHKGIDKVKPGLLQLSANLPPKEEIKQAVKVIGVAVAVAMVAGAIANGTTALVDQIAFPDISGPY